MIRKDRRKCRQSLPCPTRQQRHLPVRRINTLKKAHAPREFRPKLHCYDWRLRSRRQGATRRHQFQVAVCLQQFRRNNNPKLSKLQAPLSSVPFQVFRTWKLQSRELAPPGLQGPRRSQPACRDRQNRTKQNRPPVLTVHLWHQANFFGSPDLPPMFYLHTGSWESRLRSATVEAQGLLRRFHNLLVQASTHICRSPQATRVSSSSHSLLIKPSMASQDHSTMLWPFISTGLVRSFL